ncbi:type II toxin-antitoxin system RelE/ParE family toxin [Mesorhizobium xinjiangense]|uniref:type II toxin-antitoxin system RelE/ParE family toxin n=1 Tax=Mesorhizobium xinjiangense TaxID=2678685 RepID=UPI001F43B8C3|nr:type II toxin-antitoxin system RelE/ParE family toxin [Mesorhizobium xinjiangense]
MASHQGRSAAEVGPRAVCCPAGRLDDLKIPPSNNLEALKGDRKGEYSIRISGSASRYRIVFRWSEDGAHDIKIEDYHRR